MPPVHVPHHHVLQLQHCVRKHPPVVCFSDFSEDDGDILGHRFKETRLRISVRKIVLNIMVVLHYGLQVQLRLELTNQSN